MCDSRLEKAKIGEQWKDQHDMVWQVSDIIDSCMPAVVVFCCMSNLKVVNQDKTAFDGEYGWVKLVTPKLMPVSQHASTAGRFHESVLESEPTKTGARPWAALEI